MSNDNKLEQLKVFFQSTGITDPKVQRKMAKQAGVSIPLASVTAQLKEVKLVTEHLGKATKRNPDPKPKDYITVPALEFENDGARGFWVNATYARRVAERILEVCDAESVD